MEGEKYGVIESGKNDSFQYKSIGLLKVPHKGKALFSSYPYFGLRDSVENLGRMKEPYPHPETGEKISFREPTTSESVSIISYNSGSLEEKKALAMRNINLGRILRASEGVYVNPPKDKEGNFLTDEKTLKSFFKSENKNNGIYLLDNDFGFAPYETFKQGEQNYLTFIEGGLARLLEHTDEKKAKNFERIVSKSLLETSADVRRFDASKEPALKFAKFDLYTHAGLIYRSNKIILDCGFDESDKAYSFGILLD